MGGGAPQSPAWSYRHKEGGKPAEHHLYDQVWPSCALGPRVQGTFIDRWTRRGGDGSDHDPAWVNRDLKRPEEDRL